MRGAAARKHWLDVRGSYWFIPALLSLFAFALALFTIHIDRAWGSAWLRDLSWYEATRPEGARAQLNVVTTGMLSVSSTLFAITIAAVAFASGNYGPRLLANFMNDRGNQVSLGVFIATFVYNLMLLRVVRDEAGQGGGAAESVAAFVPQFSMLVSTFSVIVSVGVLVYFLNHTPASIRINTVLAGIGRHLVHSVEERFPLRGGPEDSIEPERGEPVPADKIGYIEIIAFTELDEIAREAGAKISLRARTGDFVHPHRPLAELCGAPLDENLKRRIRACFSLGASRTPEQDIEFLIDELVEIGLRALSPGINDPFTAVTSIHWMGAGMARLAERDLSFGPEHECYDRERVQVVSDDFSHFLKRSFGSIRPSAAGSPIAAKMFIDALWGVAIGAVSRERRDAIREEARRLLRQAETALEGPAIEEVRERVEELEQKMAGLET